MIEILAFYKVIWYFDEKSKKYFENYTKKTVPNKFSIKKKNVAAESFETYFQIKNIKIMITKLLIISCK